jgi:hypothetical protein
MQTTFGQLEIGAKFKISHEGALWVKNDENQASSEVGGGKWTGVPQDFPVIFTEAIITKKYRKLRVDEKIQITDYYSHDSNNSMNNVSLDVVGYLPGNCANFFTYWREI